MLQTQSESSRPPKSPDHFHRLHLTESLNRLGGVETLVKLMMRHDPASAAVSLLDCGEPHERQLYHFRPHSFAGAVSGRKRLLHPPLSADVLIFHNYSGMTMLSGSIAHERAVLYLHTNSEDVFRLLPRRLEFLDAIITSGNSLATELKQRFPGCPVPLIPLEIPLSEHFFAINPVEKRNGLVLGYSGRLEAEQKQVGRLSELCAHLEAQKTDFRLEIAGTGPEEGRLRRQLAGKQVQFLGRLNEVQMAEAYRNWDFLVCTSDYETGPLVVLEAMAAGVTPIMPDIPCQATALLHENGFPTYPKGDMTAAAPLIIKLAAQKDQRALREKIRQSVAGRKPDIFVASLAVELGKILQTPGHAKRMGMPRGLAEFLPFSIRGRMKGKETFLR